eukprot:scaffold27748_cov112-Isochrysis_galbana.AAC.3
MRMWCVHVCGGLRCGGRPISTAESCQSHSHTVHCCGVRRQTHGPGRGSGTPPTYLPDPAAPLPEPASTRSLLTRASPCASPPGQTALVPRRPPRRSRPLRPTGQRWRVWAGRLRLRARQAGQRAKCWLWSTARLIQSTSCQSQPAPASTEGAGAGRQAGTPESHRRPSNLGAGPGRGRWGARASSRWPRGTAI